jgi:hypothetical protein
MLSTVNSTENSMTQLPSKTEINEHVLGSDELSEIHAEGGISQVILQAYNVAQGIQRLPHTLRIPDE